MKPFKEISTSKTRGQARKEKRRTIVQKSGLIAADFNMRMITVKVRQYRQGYPPAKIHVLAYKSGIIGSLGRKCCEGGGI